MSKDRILVGEALWREIRARARASKSLLAVVSYLGRHPGSLLRWPQNSVVVCDLSRDTVARGASSARGGRELRSKGVDLYSVRGLHAKIYIFDKSAIVGSANISENSTTLIEAGVLITDAGEVRRLRVFAEQLRLDALPLNDSEILDQLVSLEPKKLMIAKRGVLKGLRAVRLPFFDNDPVWLYTCAPDEDGSVAETRAKAKHVAARADEHGVASTDVHWINECGRRAASAIGEYHYIFFWWETTSRATKAKYGWLDGPWQSIGGIDLGTRFGVRRYCVPHIARRRRVIALDRAAVKGLATVLGRGPATDLAKLRDSIEARVPVQLSGPAIRRLYRFMKRRL